MAYTDDFVIEECVLNEYKGPGGNVLIPNTISEIGESAFLNCKRLKKVTIPEGVVNVGSNAFACCENLVDISLPDSAAMIGNNAFRQCKNLQSISIPSSMKSIGENIFGECGKLAMITLPAGLSIYGLGISNAAVAVKGKSETRFFAYANKIRDGQNNIRLIRQRRWARYDAELIGNGPDFKYPLCARLLAGLDRLAHPTGLAESVRKGYLTLLTNNIEQLVLLAEDLSDPFVIDRMYETGVINEANLKYVNKRIAASTIPAIASRVRTILAKSNAVCTLSEEYAAAFDAMDGDLLLKLLGIGYDDLPTVFLQDGTPAPKSLLQFIVARYGAMESDHFTIDQEAEDAAALLQRVSLVKAVEEIIERTDRIARTDKIGGCRPELLMLQARFASPEQIRQMIARFAKEERETHRSSKDQETHMRFFINALTLSDTREAVIWLEKYRSISYYDPLKYYAEIRGVNVDIVRDRILFDFGFADNGKRELDLGSTVVEVSLGSDLRPMLYDIKAEKMVVSLPKRGANPVLYESALNALKDMKYNIKKAYIAKKWQLFDEYLNSVATDGGLWMERFLKNPPLLLIASLLVWTQDGKTFTVSADGSVDAEGSKVELSGAPIGLAHPMELEKSTVLAWQRFFLSHGLKQPFLQIWEPVRDPQAIYRNRYVGISIPVRFLNHAEHRGIRFEWNSYSDIGPQLWIEGVNTEVTLADDDSVEITSFEPLKWNRRMNMIVAFFDRLTVYGRIKKDDLTVMDLMDSFTHAQIKDFIDIAREMKSIGVLAALMDYQHRVWSDIDPLAEFTLYL